MDQPCESLATLPDPSAHEFLEFRYFAHEYHLIAEADKWALVRVADARRLAWLSRTESGWVVVPPEGDGQWNDKTHGHALKAFLDDNDEWEFIAETER